MSVGRAMLGVGAAAVVGAAAPATAHLVESGVSPFYDGAAHVFVSPEDGKVVKIDLHINRVD